MNFSLCAFVCDVHASTNAGTYTGMRVSMCDYVYTNTQPCAHTCAVQHHEHNKDELSTCTTVLQPSRDFQSTTELCGLLASVWEEGRQGEGLGAQRMMKCSGSSNLLADEFIPFLTTLKSQEGIVACFGDKKVK